MVKARFGGGVSVIDRRIFICTAVLVAMPSSAWAQRSGSGKAYRIGILAPGTVAQETRRIDALRQGLRDLGWINERALEFEERYADGHYERLPQLAAALVALNVDVIVATGGTPTVRAAMSATQKIPIVFPVVGDPVALGMVASLAHPGGNVTGITNMSTELYAKRLELLYAAVPTIKRVALVVNDANAFGTEFLRLTTGASRALAIQLEVFGFTEVKDLEPTFDKIARAGVTGVMLEADRLVSINIDLIGAQALKHRLPIMSPYFGNGILLTYAPDFVAQHRRAAVYIEKILKGAKPGDLPIEQPTEIKLIVNLKTAKAIGITIPQSLLLRADEVIQ
jgi:putative ABC transport system substrate-binding protein